MTEIVYNRSGVPFDIDSIATDLNGKADCDLTNVNSSGTSRSAGWAMPNTYTDLTVGASGATYTAPANGYVFISVYTTSSGNTYSYIDFDGKWYPLTSGALDGITNSIVFPILKGKSFAFGYQSSVTVGNFRFYNAQGEV